MKITRGRVFVALFALYAFSASAQSPQPHQGQGPRPNPQNPNSGGGNNPKPSTPTPSPQPTTGPGPNNPQPFPTPPPEGPTQAEIEAARQAGQADGRPDGAREGNDRGPADGKREGYDDGRDQGYRRCFDQEKDHASDVGYSDGYRRGDEDGGRDGITRGEREGYDQGDRDGRIDGDQRANRDAKSAATPPGRQQGYQEAAQGDSDARGYADGLIGGDARARETAQRVDYARGKKDYFNERFAEPIQTQDQFAQKSAIAFNDTKSTRRSFDAEMFAVGGNAPAPDCRFCNPRRNFKSSQEQEAYRSAYQSSYTNSFRSTYDSRFRTSYDQGLNDGKEKGCREAKNQNFQRYYDDAYARGKNDGYSKAYKSAYDRTYRLSYDRQFRDVSDQVYNQNYDDYYRSHYEAARAAAYRERSGQMYNAGYSRGDAEKYAQVYPSYAQQEYERGRQDEANDFSLRPVRLIGAIATETVQNGLYEPGEPLRFKVDLRNFSDGTLNPQDISLSVRAMDLNGIVISEPQSVLVRSLNPKSLTAVSEALELVLMEQRLNRVSTVVVSGTYMGRDIGSTTISMTAKYMISLEFAEAPKLTEGIAATFKVRVRNQSPTASTGALGVEVLSDSNKIELIRKTASIADLPVGGSAVVEFTAIGRTHEASPLVSMALLSTSASGRRVGTLDFSGQVPMLNDYRLTTSGDIRSLRGSGITRIPYTIRNISSRLLFKGLQLRMTVVNAEDDDTFVILGRNPQFLTPLDNGRSLNFVFPIMAKKPNKGAIIELEVQEDGRTTVIHRIDFREEPRND